MRSLLDSVINLLLTATATSTGTITSATFDLLGFEACTFNLHYGATAPAPTSYTIEESDDNSSWAAAPAASIIDDGGAHAVSTTRRIAYIGTKRYARAVVVQSASTILTISGTKGLPHFARTTNPATT